jgi:hypothetical protein
MMSEKEFLVEVDGRTVRVDQENQWVTVLDAEGAVVFRDRIQVAAGSLQGLFSAVDGVSKFGLGGEPAAKS